MEQLVILFILICLGYFFGKRAESNHYKSITARESQFHHFPCTTSKYPLNRDVEIAKSEMLTGSVVISVDYFKRVVAALRKFVGGNVVSYETLLDRARREATLRVLEQCGDADELINLRIETSTISDGRQSSVGSVEVLACGTAIYYK